VAVWDRTGSPIKGELVKPTTKPRRHTFQTEVVAATRTAGGTFGPPQVVSDPRFDSDEASLSVNSAGQAALAWVLNTRNDKHFRIGAAFREPGERFGKAHFLTPDGRDSYGASIALDEQGRALLVWAIEGERRTMESDDNQVLAAVRSPGGPLEAPLKLSDRHASFPEAAMAPDGRAVVGWVRQSGQGNLVQARAITTAGVYGPLTAVSPRGWIDNLATTIDDSGASAFTWTREGSDHRDRLEAITLAR
jgi:hypothetical protein